MAGNRTVQNYGGPYIDQETVSNAETQMSANKGNRLMEDVAQMTRTSTKVRAKFSTTATAAPVAVTVTSGETQWGTGSSYNPAIQKTATGTYELTYATSYADSLENTVADAIAETETLALEYARGYVMGNSDAIVRCTASANVITAYVRTGGALSDLGGGVAIVVEGE